MRETYLSHVRKWDADLRKKPIFEGTVKLPSQSRDERQSRSTFLKLIPNPIKRATTLYHISAKSAEFTVYTTPSPRSRLRHTLLNDHLPNLLYTGQNLLS